MSLSTGFLAQSVTAVINASVASASYQFVGQGEAQADSVRIYNGTNGVAWVKYGIGAGLTAVIPVSGTPQAQTLPVPPSATDHQICFIRVPPGTDGFAVILATGATAGPVTITKGDGGV